MESSHPARRGRSLVSTATPGFCHLRSMAVEKGWSAREVERRVKDADTELSGKETQNFNEQTETAHPSFGT